MSQRLGAIFSRTTKSAQGCLEWQGGLTQTGYARIPYKCKTRLGARLVMELIHGPLPRTLQVCHSCDNRKCINPDHLWIGTRKQNQQDAVKKGRYRGQELTHCKRGHEFSPENTGRSWRGQRVCRKCRCIHNKIYQKKRRALEISSI